MSATRSSPRLRPTSAIGGRPNGWAQHSSIWRKISAFQTLGERTTRKQVPAPCLPLQPEAGPLGPFTNSRPSSSRLFLCSSRTVLVAEGMSEGHGTSSPLACRDRHQASDGSRPGRRRRPDRSCSRCRPAWDAREPTTCAAFPVDCLSWTTPSLSTKEVFEGVSLTRPNLRPDENTVVPGLERLNRPLARISGAASHQGERGGWRRLLWGTVPERGLPASYLPIRGGNGSGGGPSMTGPLRFRWLVRGELLDLT